MPSAILRTLYYVPNILCVLCICNMFFYVRFSEGQFGWQQNLLGGLRIKGSIFQLFICVILFWDCIIVSDVFNDLSETISKPSIQLNP